MNTIGDMQNEMDFSYHCNEFEYIQGFVNLLVYEILDNNVYLYEIDYYFISKLQYKLINQKSPYS